jgi:TolB protein
MNNDGSDLTIVVIESAVYGVKEPEFSPDGEKIVMGGNAEGLYVANADGTNVTQITSGRDGDPDWSPDGTKILFTRSTPTANRELWTVNPDGTNEVQLTTTEFD